MVEISRYLKMTLFSRWFNYFWPRDVIFGRKPLVGVGNVGLAHHWAIKVNLALTMYRKDLVTLYITQQYQSKVEDFFQVFVPFPEYLNFNNWKKMPIKINLPYFRLIKSLRNTVFAPIQQGTEKIRSCSALNTEHQYILLASGPPECMRT